MHRKFFPALTCLLAILVSVQAADVPKDVRGRLFALYDQKNLAVVRNSILVTALNNSGTPELDYIVNYDHFYSKIPKSIWPKGYLKRNLLDEFTTEEVQSSATFTDPMVVGEMVRVKKFYVAVRGQTTLIDFYLEALDGKRVARLQTVYRNGDAGFPYKLGFGVHFRFLFGLFGPDTAALIRELRSEIDPYFVPRDEYQEAKRKASETAEERKHVTIQPGMSKDEVVQILGEPVKTITFGAKTMLKYADITVELQDGKVTDVKAN